MEKQKVANYRAKEILGLLKEHGPLSFKTISKMVMPQMKEKKLRAAISRLTKKELVKKRLEKPFGGHGVFYQLVPYEQERKLAAKILGCSPQELEQPEFRYRELLHTETCALWSFYFKQLFPESLCIRDFEFSKSELAKKIMSSAHDDADLRPDLLLVFKKRDNKGITSIAVEIEKTRKTNQRLFRKLYKYANASYVDGLIYACESKRIKEVIQLIYKTRIQQKAGRIKHYSDNFFLFSDAVDKHMKNVYQLYNSNQKAVSLIDWTYYLQNKSFNQRRDQEIDSMGESASPCNSAAI